ncbi:hypothetical protein BY996DRAFT_6478645 [Phakopsora pachyrhizi]|nr:hypothetical protein BY996DRAFT_6478645 [Phakopsora pachyrhizi]
MHLPVTSNCPQKANPLITKKHHHPPRFTVPEPVELGIKSILPICCSTSPSPKPPPIPKPSYLMNFRSMIGQPSQFSDQADGETTDGLDDHAMNLKQRLEAMRETGDDVSADVNGFKRDKLEEILVESIFEKVEAKRKKNNMLATTSTTSVVAKDQTQKACLQLEGNSKLKKISIEKTVVRTDGNICNQLNQDQSEGDVNKMRTVKALDSWTAPLTSRVTFEKPRSLPPPSSLLRPRKTMPNLGSLETPTDLSLATAKKTSSKTSFPPNSSSAVQKPDSTTSTANTITRTTRLEKRLLAPLSLNSNASRPPLFNTSIKKSRFMATATTI